MQDPKSLYNKYRIFFAKDGAARFIGHLDLQSLFAKAIKRAALPVAYSQGFNPHQLMSFAMPLSLGMAGRGEILEIFLTKQLNPNFVAGSLQGQMPAGLRICRVEEVPNNGKSAAALVYAARYLICFPFEMIYAARFAMAHDVMRNDRPLIVETKTKKGIKSQDIGQDIFAVGMNFGETTGCIEVVLAAGSSRNLKPQVVGEYFAKLLRADILPQDIYYERIELLLDKQK
jgi:radical SAM-linked protein